MSYAKLHGIDEALDDLIALRPLPETATRLVTACNDDDIPMQQIGQIISLDPVLSVRLLEMANSPLFGFTGEIKTVQHATVVLGRRALKNLAVSIAVKDVFGNGDTTTTGFRKKLWSHAMACGSISRTLAASTKLTATDEAFISGVIHDVGKLLLTDYRPAEYMSLVEANPVEKRFSLELETFGLAHTSVGRKCSECWGLPDELNDVVAFHHNPQDSDFGGGLVDVVSAGNQLTKIWDPLEATSSDLDAHSVLLEIGIDLSPEEIERLHEQAIADLNILREVHGCS